MIQADHPLTVTRRCELLDVARSTVYYHPTGIPSKDLALMRLLDEIHLERPFYGSRRLRDELETQGHPVNRKRVQRLMRQMGLSALYPKPRTSQPGAGHKVYPPGFPISPWYRTHRINRRVLSLQGSDARSRTTEGDTWWVKKKTVRFSSHSTAC